MIEVNFGTEQVPIWRYVQHLMKSNRSSKQCSEK